MSWHLPSFKGTGYPVDMPVYDIGPNAIPNAVCRGDVDAPLRMREEQNRELACARRRNEMAVGQRCRRHAKAWRRRQGNKTEDTEWATSLPVPIYTSQRED